MRRTPLAQLIEAKLGRPLSEHVVAARNADDHRSRSWRAIARDLTDRTGLTIQHETLRAWFSDDLRVVLRDPDPAEPAAVP